MKKSKLRKSKRFIIIFLAPAVVCFLIVFLYPVLRTVLMSFNDVRTVTDDVGKWTFVGFSNYVQLFSSKVFLRSLVNVGKIWIIEGVAVLSFAMMYAVVITSGIKGKSFWRSMLYLPNVISAVALATMWLQYVFNNQYGFFKTLFEALGMQRMAEFQWTAPENLFMAMMIAVAYGAIGYYVLILVAGIDSISTDYYEAATIEGAGVFTKLFRITIPLLKDIIKRCIILWTATAIGFFVWSTLFSFNPEMSTITPVVYMYEMVFGKSTGLLQTNLNVGIGAAVGVVLMIFVLVVNTVINVVIKSDDEA